MLQTLLRSSSTQTPTSLSSTAENFWPNLLLDEEMLFFLGTAFVCLIVRAIVMKVALRERKTPCSQLTSEGQRATLVGFVQSERPAASPMTGEPCIYSLVKLIEPGVGRVEGAAEYYKSYNAYRWGYRNSSSITESLLYDLPDEELNSGIREFVPDWVLEARFKDETGSIGLDFEEAHVDSFERRETVETSETKKVLETITDAAPSEYLLGQSKIVENYLPLDAEVVLTGTCLINPDHQSFDRFVFKVTDIALAHKHHQVLKNRWFQALLTALPILFLGFSVAQAIKVYQEETSPRREPTIILPTPEPLIRHSHQSHTDK